MSKVQQSQQSPDAKKVGSDGEDFSDTVNETGTFELCSDANKTATSSSHQDSEYDTASDSQSSDEAEPLHKCEPVVDSGGGINISESLIDLVTAKASTMQIRDENPVEESSTISHKENDLYDDADGEADDDDDVESLNHHERRGFRGGGTENDEDDEDDEDNDGRSDDESDAVDNLHHLEESQSDNGSIILDLEPQRGDGDGEEEQNEDSKKVDDDEDRSNPQYIPKRGIFYEHDDRTAEDPDANSVDESGVDEQPPTSAQKKTLKKATDRWTHDFFDASEQAPKSRTELVNSYGYDIRNEDGPPKTRRNRRYNRGPSKYTRKWEDESAYAKNLTQTRNPRPEDFPELGSKVDRRNRSSHHDREEKQNKVRQNYQNDDDIRNCLIQRTNSSHPNDRRDNERRDNSRSRHQYDRYGPNRGNKNESDDRRKGYNSRGRNTIEFKNQNRNKSSEYESHSSGGLYNRNSSGSQFEQRNQTHHYKREGEHVESVSFTNSKLNNNSNRFSYIEYSNNGSMQNGEYDISQSSQEKTMNQQSQSQQRFQLGSNDVPTRNLESGIQISNQQNSQSTLLTTNHPLSISSDVIATTGSAASDQQALHGQTINHAQQQPMGHIQGAGHVKRYSNQRQRTGLETQTQPQPQTQQLGMNVVIQQQQQSQQSSQQPQTPHQTTQQTVVPNVSAPTQFQPNYFPNEYPPINQIYVSDIRQQTSGASAYLQQGAPPPPVGATVGVVPQIMNFVPAHTPMQAAPVVQPAPNTQIVAQPSQGQYPSYPTYAGVQNYNSASGITYYAPQTQPPPRPILPQRRQKNAIPIMAPPPERRNKNAHGNRSVGSGSNASANDSNNNSDQTVDNAENIDHILDNMFVQRPHPYQSVTGLAESAVSTRKDSTPLIDQKLNDVDASGKSYLQEQIGHETAPTSTLLQTKDETDTSEQTTASFGDVNISAAN